MNDPNKHTDYYAAGKMLAELPPPLLHLVCGVYVLPSTTILLADDIAFYRDHVGLSPEDAREEALQTTFESIFHGLYRDN